MYFGEAVRTGHLNACATTVERVRVRAGDNPYSEAQFKTLKYRPDFPAQFTSLEHARGFLRDFFAWYNAAHRHVGAALMTPKAVHYGEVDAVVTHRSAVLTAAYRAHPERFIRRRPRAQRPSSKAGINPPNPVPDSLLVHKNLSRIP